MSKMFIKIPYVIMCVMALLNLWVIVYRLSVAGSNSFIMYVYAMVSIWYLPKLLIIPFLSISSLKDFVLRFVFKKRELSSKQESRREFIKGAGWTLASVPFVAALNGAINTVYDFEVIETDIPIKNLPVELEGVKIVQISDFHAGSYYSDKPVRIMREIIEGLSPDIMVITGDFVNFHHYEFNHVYKEFSKFEAKYGVYACLGNHDHYVKGKEHEELKNVIGNAGIDIIINDNRLLEINGSKLNLAGVDNWGRGQTYGDFKGTEAKTDGNYPTVLLCHDPSNWRPRVRDEINIDLMLSGHTHGGQIGFEYEGINLHPVQMVYEEFAGLYSYGDKHLYVNRGCGVVGPPIRIGVRPEISVLRLRKKVGTV